MFISGVECVYLEVAWSTHMYSVCAEYDAVKIWVLEMCPEMHKTEMRADFTRGAKCRLCFLLDINLKQNKTTATTTTKIQPGQGPYEKSEKWYKMFYADHFIPSYRRNCFSFPRFRWNAFCFKCNQSNISAFLLSVLPSALCRCCVVWEGKQKFDSKWVGNGQNTTIRRLQKQSFS